MKRYLQESIFIPVFLVLLGAFLYYLFYKPVEGFFAKTDACARAIQDRNFIQNQVNDVSNNLATLQSKLDKVEGIRSEIQGFLTKNNCLIFDTSKSVCTSGINTYNTLSTQITNALNDKKRNEELIADANTRLPGVNANITTLTSQLTTLRTDPYLNCDRTKGTVYLTAEQCTAVVTATTQKQTELNTNTTTKITLETQLTTATANLATANNTIATAEASRRTTQIQLDTNKCTTVRNTFTCNELNGQLRQLERVLENARFEQTGFLNFFTTNSQPLTQILNDLNQYVCP